MAKKYYAVRNGRTRGIFLTWEDCKAQITGVSGAEYKGFAVMSDAEAYLRGEEPSAETTALEEPVIDDSNKAVAYVDGSFSPDTGEFSCGAVLFYKGEKKLFSHKYSDPEMASMRNVAGEIMGAVSVIKYCLSQGIPALEIHHDYEGVEKWATGEWKTTKVGTSAYARECNKARDSLELSFVKVKSHSGDTYNDMADALAKKALGIAE